MSEKERKCEGDCRQDQNQLFFSSDQKVRIDQLSGQFEEPITISLIFLLISYSGKRRLHPNFGQIFQKYLSGEDLEQA